MMTKKKALKSNLKVAFMMHLPRLHRKMSTGKDVDLVASCYSDVQLRNYHVENSGTQDSIF